MNTQETTGGHYSKLQGEKSWFLTAGLGVFIHFGLYSLLGGNENDYHGRTPREYRDELMPRFDPHRFDADEWVAQIKGSGARYLVITTKHGEGFCLWPTKVHDYHVGNTPFSRDIIGELAQACRKANFRFGLYFASDNWYYTESGEYEQSVEAYSAFVGGMLDELMTNYGPICELWLDGSTPLLPPSHLGPLLASCREKQPGMVINDRGVNQDEHGLPFGDFVTPERFFPVAVDPDHEFIEICDAMGLKGWGYHNDEQFHSGTGLIYRFAHARSLGANYLLNVEPSPEGVIRAECVERLRAMGEWNARFANAALEAGPCPAVPSESFEQNSYSLGRTTRSGQTIYVHLERWPRTDRLLLEGVHGTGAKASVLGTDASLVTMDTDAGTELSRLPAVPPDGNPVIAVTFDHVSALPQQFAPRARTVRVEKVPTYVPAQSAELLASYGGLSWHLYESYRNGAQTVGRWVHNSSRIRWRLHVAEAGSYTLYASLGTTDAQAGATARFEVAGHSVEFTTVSTGHYSEGFTHRVGTLQLPGGEIELVLSSPQVTRFFPNVHHLILVPEA